MANASVDSASSKYLILLLLKTHSSFLVTFLERSGYAAFEAHSTDHLVALCLGNAVDAVIVDVCQLAEIEGWSVAQSVKMVNPSLAVILLCHGDVPKTELPTSVDAIANDSDLSSLIALLDRYTKLKAAANL